MSSPEPIDFNKLQAEDVTIPNPETVTPSPNIPPNTSPHSGPPHRRPWRQTRERPAAKKTPPTRAPKIPSEIPRPKRGMFVKPLTQTYTSVGIMLMPIDPVCANLFIVNAESVARAWDEAAYENDTVRKFLNDFLKTSIAARVMMAHVPIIIGMFVHHSKRAQDMLGQMGEGFANTVENNLRVNDMGNGIEEP